MSTIDYIKNFIKDRNVASITPSSSFVVRRVSRKIDFGRPIVVVEYGPGGGVFTRYFAEHMSDDSKLILIERNEDFVRSLQDEFGDDERVHIFNDSAENVEELTERVGVEHVDYVVSGIPFSFLSDQCRRSVLEQTYAVLGDGGKFLVYQHYNHMQEALARHFDRVYTERELRNIPPLCIWEAIKWQNGRRRD